MRYEIELYFPQPLLEVDKLAEMMCKIKEFSVKAGFNTCVLMSLNDDSAADHGRIDIEVVHRNVDYENHIIKTTVWQKLFYIDGEVIDCDTYSARYSLKRREYHNND